MNGTDVASERACICDQRCPATGDRHWVNCPAHAYYEAYLALTRTPPQVAGDASGEAGAKRLRLYAASGDLQGAYAIFPHPEQTMLGDLRAALAAPRTAADVGAIKRACFDPGYYVGMRAGRSLSRWQADAVIAAIRTLPPGAPQKDVWALADAGAYLIDRYRRLWKGEVVRDLCEAEGAWRAATGRLPISSPEAARTGDAE